MKVDSKFHRSLRILLATSVLAGGFASAQDEEEKKPDRMLRILPLGDPPPWDEVNDGVRRIEKDPPPGSVPPQEIVQMDSEGGEKGDPVRLRLGQFSSGLPVNSSVALFDVDEIGAGAKPWVKLTMPRGKSHGLAVLWRDPVVKKWTTARNLMLAEDLISFPPGSLRFVNVTPWTAEFSIDGQVVKLEKGKHATSRPRPAFNGLPLEVRVSNGGAKMKIADEAIKQSASQRTTIYVFLADGEKKRSPAKVKVVLENARNLPKLPKRK